MTIEMSSPGELFKNDPEMARIAKGELTVEEARKILHAKVRKTEPIEPSQIAQVNTDARMEMMKTKTRELMASVAASGKITEEIMLLVDMFDCLALDWVYSNRLLWEGSLADGYAQKIISRLGV